MTKNRKRIISMLLIMVMVFSQMGMVSANTEENERIYVDESSYYMLLTEEQMIQRISEIDNITVGEATQIYSSIPTTYAAGIANMEFITTKDFGGDRVIEAGALMKVETMTSGTRWFVGAPIRTWSTKRSSGSFTWSQAYLNVEVPPSEGDRLIIECRGSVNTTVTYTTNAEIYIGNAVYAFLGFSASVQAGLSVTYTKLDTFSKNFRI